MRSAYDTLIRPVVTEKAVKLAQSENKYTFYVNPKSNKIEIKKAVEDLFKVHVQDVNTANVKGKKKRVGRSPEGYRPNRKKAIISLRPGDKIEIFEGLF
ncbi:MAG: 50S ribosomal protein L23 [Firmicutes bacterium]|nr:50S ribosomal protein L23 [Bacillota bacterium]